MERSTTGKPSLLARMPRDLRYLALFFLLSFAISWLFFIPGRATANQGLVSFLAILGAFGPLAAALIVIRISRGKEALKEWLRLVFRIRIPVSLYLLGGVVIPLGIGIGHFALYQGLGGNGGFASASPLWAYPLYLIPTALFSGGNEEPGWRGFALPTLLKYCRPVTAAIILGLVHSAWHLPLMSHYGTHFGWYMFNMLPLTVWLNYLYVSSQGSIWPVMLLHAGTNVIGEFFPTPDTVLGGMDGYLMIRGALYWMIAVLIVVGTKGELGRKLPDRLGRLRYFPSAIWDSSPGPAS